MTMADILLEFAKSVAGFLLAGSNLKRARNQDIAALLERASQCLSTIAQKVESGQEPVAECHELLMYAQLVPRQLRKAAGLWNPKSAAALSGYLEAAVEAPSRAVLNLSRQQSMGDIVFLPGSAEATMPDYSGELRKLREAAGLLLGAANLVRAGAGVTAP